MLRIAERLRRDIAAKAFADCRGGAIRLTCSIGFSMHPLAAHGDMATFETAVELADFALYPASCWDATSASGCWPPRRCRRRFSVNRSRHNSMPCWPRAS
ncbi:hypothetical protein SALBM135S_05841 [Streptomyces alboniger]